MCYFRYLFWFISPWCFVYGSYYTTFNFVSIVSYKTVLTVVTAVAKYTEFSSENKMEHEVNKILSTL